MYTVGVGLLLRWAYNRGLAPLFHLPVLGYAQAGALWVFVLAIRRLLK